MTNLEEKYEYITKFSIEKNKEILTSKEEFMKNFTKESTYKIKFRCECKKEFEKTIRGFKQSQNCNSKCPLIAPKYFCKQCDTQLKNNTKHGMCNRCNNMKYTYQDISKLFSDNNCKLLSTKEEYKKITTPLKFICSCGEESYKSISTFEVNPYCNSCSSFKSQMGCSKAEYIIELKKIFENRGFQLLSTKYVGINEKLDYICDNGHTTTITAQAIKLGHGCKYCADHNKTADYNYFYGSARIKKLKCLKNN